jgi:hypothetical protein
MSRYGRFGVSIVEEGEQGAGYGQQGYVDVAMPPPPPPQVSTGEDWSNPYTARPPLVSVPASEPSSFDWMGMGQKFTTGLFNIFGQAVNPQGDVIQQRQPPPQRGMPLWGWVAIGVGGVVVLGVVARSLRSRSYAGYGRRHRRSRR